MTHAADPVGTLEVALAHAARPEFQPAAYADMIRKVGVDHVIMGSDFGQPGRPMPPDGLALFAGVMRKEGFSEQELYRMMAENPARAMGLPPASRTASPASR